MYSYLDDDIAEYSLSDTSITPYRNMRLWLDRWEEQLQMQKVSPKTIKSYKDAIATFFDFVKKQRKVPIEKIGARYINRYLIDYQIKVATDKYEKGKLEKEDLDMIVEESKKKSIGKNDANFTVLEDFENTLSQRITIVKMFLKFITENNKEQHDYTKLFDYVAKIKVSEKFTPYLTEDELFKVVEFMQIWPEVYKGHRKRRYTVHHAYRDATLMIIYALTGARSEEVVFVKLKDLELFTKNSIDRYIVKIEKGKGGKKRKVGILRSHLEKLIEYLQNVLPSEEHYLSSTHGKNGYNNRAIHPNRIREFSNDILRILDINKTGLHAFRRGYVTKRIGSDDVDVSVVAKEVGNTTAILEKHYLKHSPEAFMK